MPAAPILYNTLEYRPASPTTAGTELSLDQWGVVVTQGPGGGLKRMKIDYESQETDMCKFTAASSSIDEPYLFQPFSTCIIRQGRIKAPDGTFSGGKCLFMGLVVQTPDAAQGGSEAVSYTLHGPWWYLLNRTFELDYIQAVSIVGTTVTYETLSSGHLWLNRDINRNWLCTGEQIEAAVKWVITKGAPIQLLPDVAVPLNPGFTLPIGRTAQISAGIQTFSDVPIDEVVDITSAEVIKKQIRWNPDCVTWFDYSTVDTTPAGVPTFHCARYQYLTPATMKLLAGNANGSISIKSGTISPRYDLVRPFVTINFEVLNTLNGQQSFATVPQSWPNPPPNEGVNSFGGLVTTIRLLGSSQTIVQATLRSRPVPLLDGSDDYEGLEELLSKRHSFLNDGATIAEWAVTDDITDAAGVVTPTPPERKGLLQNYMDEGSGQMPSWVVNGATGNPAVTQEDTLYAFVEITRRDGAIHTRRLDVKLHTTDLNTGGVQKTFTKVTGTPQAESPPPNLAEELYDALSVLQYSGEVEWKATECDTNSCWLGNTLNFSDTVRYNAMNAVVQRVSLDIDKGVTSIRIGPNKILSAGEYVELLRVTRQRLVFGDQSSRNAQLAPTSETTDLGTATPIDASNAGGGHDPVVMASDSPVGGNNQVALVGGSGQFGGVTGLVIGNKGDNLIVAHYADAQGNQIRFQYVPVWVQDPVTGTCKQMKQMFWCGPVVPM